MTSKSSFLVSIKENNKRRLWVWVVAILIFMLIFPVVTAYGLSSIARNNVWIWEALDRADAQQLIHEKMAGAMTGLVGFSGMLLVFSVIIAVISAVQGFSYLYSRKKIDFYMGMPVKRKRRFLVIWLNGILLYIIPYLLGLVISLLIGAGNGAVDGAVLYTAVASFVVHLCTYLGVYHLAILALMLTGNIVVTGFGFLVFCLYEFVVRYTLQGYKQKFFTYFTNYGTDTAPRLSPFRMYEKLADGFNLKNVIDIKYLLLLLLFVLVTGLLSYVCYIKRPAEAAGKAMTFEITKPFIKVLITVPVALMAGLIVAVRVNMDYNGSKEGMGWAFFMIALTVILGSAIIQVIYEFDIKGALHKKRHILISGVLAAFIFLSFQYDFFGFDTYIPSQEKIESIAFVPENYEPCNSSIYFDSDGSHLTAAGYAEKYMHLENTGEVCELIKLSMDEYDAFHKKQITDEEYEGERSYWSYATLIYRLKSGRTVYRSLWVDVEDERTGQLLDGIIGSEEFKKGFMIGNADNLNKLFEQDNYKIAASYGNTVYMERMSRAEIEELLEIYQRDLALANFSNIKNNVPAGIIKLEVTEEIPGSVYMGASGISRSTRRWDMNINIYPFYKESIAYLMEHGYYMDTQLKLEDIASIQVVNENSEAARRLEEKKQASAVMDDEVVYESAPSTYWEYGSDAGTRVYADYTEEDELKEIAACAYPADMVSNDWDRGKGLEEDYRVIVYFKADSSVTKQYGTSSTYGFSEGQVPDFVREDTAYKE